MGCVLRVAVRMARGGDGGGEEGGEGRRDGSKLKYPLRLSKSLITSSSQ